MKELLLNIAAVERDVGISKDVLRVWERRYGFPAPQRDAHGERLYTAEQVARLRLIRRLMDQGHRPGRLLSASPAELEEALATSRVQAPRADTPLPDGLQELMDGIRSHDVSTFQSGLQQRLAREGLRHFVQDTVAPMTQRIGQEWEQGQLQVFEEHLFTEVTSRVLRQAIATVPRGSSPRVLLTTLPEEPHGLGLLMLEAVLVLEGAQCLSLGTQTPMLEITHAAQSYEADVVALSFSSAFPQRQVRALLLQLRAALPVAVQLWAGGAGASRLGRIDGVQALAGLDEAAAAALGLRAHHGAAAA